MKKLTPTEKAQRYVDNAKQVLLENGEYNSEYETYENRRAVRSAGKLLWKAVENMINAVFNVKTEQLPNPDFNDYKKVVKQFDRGLAYILEADYDTIWGIMVDFGTQSKTLCDIGFDCAEELIRIFSKLLPKQPIATTARPAQHAKLLTPRSAHRATQPNLQANP